MLETDCNVIKHSMHSLKKNSPLTNTVRQKKRSSIDPTYLEVIQVMVTQMIMEVKTMSSKEQLNELMTP